MKKYLFFLFIIFFVSCSRDYSLLVDPYFAVMHNVEQSRNIQIVNFEEKSLLPFMNKKKLIVSPFLYHYYNDDFENFKGLLYLLGGNEDLEMLHNIVIDDTNAYEELVEIIKKNKEYKKISMIMDPFSNSKKACFDIMSGLENEFDFKYLILNSEIGRNSINRFIKLNSDSDLWIIDTQFDTLYSLDLIKTGNIALYQGGELFQLNERIKYSIEYDLDEKLTTILNKDVSSISSKLNKY